MTPEDSKLLCKSPYSGSSQVKVGNGTLLPISQVGMIKLPTSSRPLTLKKNVFHVPQLRHNLLSVRQLCRDNNCSVVFNASCLCVKDKTTGEVLLQAPSVGNVYPIQFESMPQTANLALSESGELWHRRLGHCGAQVLFLLRKNNSVTLNSSFSNDCTTCRLAKSHRLPFDSAEHRTTVEFALIHSKVC